MIDQAETFWVYILENNAGKAAMQYAGRTIGARLLEHVAKSAKTSATKPAAAPFATR